VEAGAQAAATSDGGGLGPRRGGGGPISGGEEPSDAALIAREGGLSTTEGLGLYWSFDDPTGTVAADSSGHGLDGTYTGVTGIPAPSVVVPALTFANPLSRAFVMANAQAVFATLPAALKLTNNLTVSAWYRTAATDSQATSIGSDIVNAGSHYLLRVRPTQIEFSKTIGVGASFAQCLATVTNHLDGRWHHIGGVSSRAGMKLYFDGREVCVGAGNDVMYVGGGTDLWVGRGAIVGAANNFDGNIDEVRIYTRALSAAEITALAHGGP
jgi:hypothetical protein